MVGQKSDLQQIPSNDIADGYDLVISWPNYCRYRKFVVHVHKNKPVLNKQWKWILRNIFLLTECKFSIFSENGIDP